MSCNEILSFHDKLSFSEHIKICLIPPYRFIVLLNKLMTCEVGHKIYKTFYDPGNYDVR